MLRPPGAARFGTLALSLALTGAATVVRAAGPGDMAPPARTTVTSPGADAGGTQDIDDPKVARRLKTRSVYVSPAAGSSPPTAAPATQPRLVPTNAPAGAASAATFEPKSPADLRKPLDAPPPPVTPVVPLAGSGGEDGITRKVNPGDRGDSPATYVPRLKLGYRRFSFVRIGATDPASTSGLAASEPFDVVSLDLYPASSYVRYGLSTQYGAESGKFMSGGDYFIAESMSLGPQIPGHIFTPFAEGFAGGGYMRRMQFGSSVPTAYWHYGVDVGTEIFMSKYAYFSLALGYLHPVNGFTKGLSFTSVYVDTWSLKIGVGL